MPEVVKAEQIARDIKKRKDRVIKLSLEYLTNGLYTKIIFLQNGWKFADKLS